ncbi:MAG: amidohydrolase [Cyclobacteriaceae bacterium]
MKNIFLFSVLIVMAAGTLSAQVNSKTITRIDERAAAIEQKVIEWRRKFHQYPELSNREFKTGAIIADHLKSLGLEVKYPVAKTGVVGILRTGKPGPVIALRADMDALPVTERNALPFASKEKGEYNGQQVDVMHACGHDTHMAILMGTAEVLTSMISELRGTIVFLFQPAEEGAPDNEEGGAYLMVKEGLLDDPKVEAVFGLHIESQLQVGAIAYRPEGIMAAVDDLHIKVTGRQTHGSAPWSGVDPIVASAHIITALQTITSRSIEVTKAPAVVTIGKIEGGVRSNIIPESVEMIGTIRTLDMKIQDQIHELVQRIAKETAEGLGATAEVTIIRGYPVTYNDPKLTAWSAPLIQRVTGKDNAIITAPQTGSEDFSFFAQKVPGFFFIVGGMPKGADPEKTPSHHTPDFFIDESGLITGLRAMLHLSTEYLYRKP